MNFAELLKSLEWANTGGCVPRCPSCKNAKKDGHKGNCELLKAMKTYGCPECGYERRSLDRNSYVEYCSNCGFEYGSRV